MIFLLVLLVIKIQDGRSYDLEHAPEDYLNYYRTEDLSGKSTSNKLGNIKYTDLLSLIHNDDSNRALLDRINENDDLDDFLSEHERNKHKNETVSVEETFANDEPVNLVSRKNANLVTVKDSVKFNGRNEIFENKPVLDQIQDIVQQNEMSKDLEGLSGEIEYPTVKDKLNIEEPIKSIVKKDFSRPKRENDILNKSLKKKETKKITKRSVLRVLRNMVHQETSTEPTISINDHLRIMPGTTKQKEDSEILDTPSSFPPVNPTFEELLQNLTESIKYLNKNLALLKSQLRDDKAYVLIKIPLNETMINKKFNRLSRNTEHARETDNILRNKRDVKRNIDKIIAETTSNDNSTTINFNVTRKGVEILSTTENVYSTIISDSETAKKDDTKELSKSKRNANTTKSELDENIGTNTTNNSDNANLINDTSSANDTKDDREFKLEHDQDNSNITNESFDIEAKINKTENKTKPDTILSGRRSFDTSEELLYVIEQTYSDIKDLISPIGLVRDKYSNNVMYKIGYIIANLETMDASLGKLKDKIYQQGNWEKNRLQKVLRKLFMSKKLVINIMKYLNKYSVGQESFVD